MSKNSNGTKFIKGAAILAGAGLLVKILGAVFRIPLNNWLGPTGMSYYSAAYAVYGALIVLSTAGLPTAISRLVSEHIALNEYKYAHKIFKTATMIMAVVGLVCFAICFFGADIIAEFNKNPKSALALKAIAPALFFVPLFSSFRGYFNGRQNMNPTALSEVSEQLVRVIVGLALAFVLLKRFGQEQAAAGASFGATAGSITGLLVIFAIFLLNRKVFKAKIVRGSQHVDSTGTIAKKIIIIAIPIIIGCEIMPIMNLIDLSMIMRILQSTGWSQTQSEYLYGLISSFCSSLIAFPQIMTQAVSVSLVPAVSGRYKVKDTDGVHDSVRLGYRTTMIMAFPCAIGMAVLAEPILKLLYFSQAEACADAAPTLAILSMGIICLAVMQTSTSILQAVGKQMVPVRNLIIGCLGKVVITLLLVRIPAINIKGAAIGTVFAYCVAMVLNARAVKKYTGTKVSFGRTYVRPCVSALVMGVVAFGAYKVVTKLLASHSEVGVNALATLIAILIAIIVYAILILVTKTITIDELENMPHCGRIARILRKFKK